MITKRPPRLFGRQFTAGNPITTEDDGKTYKLIFGLDDKLESLGGPETQQMLQVDLQNKLRKGLTKRMPNQNEKGSHVLMRQKLMRAMKKKVMAKRRKLEDEEESDLDNQDSSDISPIRDDNHPVAFLSKAIKSNFFDIK